MSAITAFLLAEVPQVLWRIYEISLSPFSHTNSMLSRGGQVKRFYKDAEAVNAAVVSASVSTIPRRAPVTKSEPDPRDFLYSAGQPVSTFTLVLNGKLTVLVGRDQFKVASGPWTVLSQEVLGQPEGQFSPDFSAYIDSEVVRVVTFSPFQRRQQSLDGSLESPSQRPIMGGAGRSPSSRTLSELPVVSRMRSASLLDREP